MQLAKLCVPSAALAFLVMTGSACQTAQKPAALVPATAPALKPQAEAAPPPPAATPDPAPQQAQTPEKAAPTEAAPPAPPVPAPDAVADLVANVETEYQAGLAAYHNGKTDEAKQHFDSALNGLLESKFDIRSDDRLQKEFDRVVQGVNDLYPGGPNEADVQQKAEPAPIDETNGITPAPDATALAKAEAEIKNTHSDLPLMLTDQVAGYIAYFSGYGRGVFERAYARSGRYHDMIVSTLKQEGLPQDLIYLAQAESGFHPLAVSRAGARGIWQFMSSRARGYGLTHNMWVDYRQDPEKSTRAAARHLKELYNQFGDWYLAMAAYNSGPGTVQSAVKRTGYADFWELYQRNVLPHETRNYVPIILAVTIMAKNPSQYGLDTVVMEKPVPYDTETITYPVDLRLVAECVNSTPAELQDLNPSLLRLSTPREGKFELRLPAGSRDQYEATMASIPREMRLWWRYHTVQSGDTLASLARNYHTTAKSIKEVNHLDGSELTAEAKLIIPVTPGKHPLSDTPTYAKRITRYHVQRGDTVETVAENFGVSPTMLRRWNGIHGSSLHGRKVLALHLPITPSSHDLEAASSPASKSKHTGTRSKSQTASTKPPATKSAEIERLKTEKEELTIVRHTVKSGETLYSIANAYRTTVAALKRDNRNVAVLHPGMVLLVQMPR